MVKNSKILKKLTVGIITVIMAVSSIFIGAFSTAASSMVNYDEWDTVDGLIVEYLGVGGEVVIPSVDRDGLPLTTIDDQAFYGNDDVTAVYICYGIVNIGKNCFKECTYLREIVFPTTVRSYNNNYFASTAELETWCINNSTSSLTYRVSDAYISGGITEDEPTDNSPTASNPKTSSPSTGNSQPTYNSWENIFGGADLEEKNSTTASGTEASEKESTDKKKNDGVTRMDDDGGNITVFLIVGIAIAVMLLIIGIYLFIVFKNRFTL